MIKRRRQVILGTGGNVRAEHARRLPLDQLELAAFATGASVHPNRRRAGGALRGDAPAGVASTPGANVFGTEHEGDDRHGGAERQGTQRELAPVDLTGAQRLMQCRQWSLRGYFRHRGNAPLSHTAPMP